MFFYYRYKKTSVTLNYNVPADYCCNCGRRTPDIDLIATPMVQVRSLLVYSEQLTITESFPYCKPCRRSARRTPFGWPGKVLLSLLNSTLLFCLFVAILPTSLPHAFRDELYPLSLILAVILTLTYFHWREKIINGRDHYQPVRLRQALIEGGRLNRLSLAFHNPRFAQDFANANPDAVRLRRLEISVLE
jgi:hypothetical protein